MNFFESYDIARSATPPSRTGSQQDGATSTAQPTFNEEVNQVVGQLGRLWGGLRKQSQTVLENARRDIGSVVVQAQKELGKLTVDPTASSSQITQEEIAASSEKERPPPDEQEMSPLGERDITDAEKLATQPSSSTPSMAPTPQSNLFQDFVARVQSSVPPNIASTIQSTIPASLRSSENIAAEFTHLRSTLSGELQRVQGITRAQAEEYVHRSEVLLRDAGEFLKDAVKIVPPEQADTDSVHDENTNVVVDGSDVWLIPSSAGFGPRTFVTSAKGKEKEGHEGQLGTGSRADALMQRLKRDPEVLKVDPASLEQSRGTFELWQKDHIESKEGGIDGNEWFAKIKSTLEEHAEGDALKATRDMLVPAVMNSQTFWTRYFFRVYQIEKDDEKRKELLQAETTENEEDFTWEDEDEDSATPPVASSVLPMKAAEAQRDDTPTRVSNHQKAKPAHDSSRSPRASEDTVGPHLQQQSSSPNSSVNTPANISPRESSEDSYDLVSTGSARTSTGAKSPSGKRSDVDDDGDSDWE